MLVLICSEYALATGVVPVPSRPVSLVTPETLSNSLAFLQMDLVDPEFHKHAHAHSRGMIAGIKALLDEAVEAGELQRCDTTRLARAVQGLIGGSLLEWAIDHAAEFSP